MASSVLVGCIERTVWVRVEGRGTFQNSVGLKQFVKQMVQRGYREFIVDLRDCELMDSTFMGTLAGVALRMREIGQGWLKVINVNARNEGLLGSLGLDHIFEVIPVATAGVESLPEELELEAAVPSSLTATTQKEAVLAAHEALVKADAGNEAKFKDVLEYLKEDLGESGSESARLNSRLD